VNMPKILFLFTLLCLSAFASKSKVLPGGESRFAVYQSADYTYSATESSSSYSVNNKIVSLKRNFGEITVTQRSSLALQTLIKAGFLYFPVDLDIAKSFHRMYNSNFTASIPEEEIENPSVSMQAGVLAKWRILAGGLTYNARYSKKSYQESESIWDSFLNKNSLSLILLLDAPLGKLPLYLIGKSIFNPANGFNFGKNTYGKLSGGMRVNLTYYVSLSALYVYSFQESTSLKQHSLAFDFHYNLTRRFALRTSYAGIIYSHKRSPSSRFSLGVDYIFTKKKTVRP
jgi:hypothetical protein